VCVVASEHFLLNGESPKAPRLSLLVRPLRTKQLGQIVEKGGSPEVVWAQHSFRHAEGGRTTARRHSAFGQVLLIAKTDKQSRHCGISKRSWKVLPGDPSAERLFPRPLYPRIVLGNLYYDRILCAKLSFALCVYPIGQ
jgi:hypothetical protein